jgi:Cu2+-exporting ATPase
MVADFRRRFWVSLVLTVPVVILAPFFQELLGLEEALAFPGDNLVQLALASAIYFYGGWPFITGMAMEIKNREPGMMLLVGLATTVAYVYSAAVALGLRGEVFFWELATLIDVMLLGHWLEMRSIMGASRALEELVRLLPAEAHLVQPDGSTREVPVGELQHGDRVLVRPGERVPTDGAVVQGRTSVNEAMLTGESAPVEKAEGDEVIGGSVNGEAAVTVEVRKTGQETYLSQVIEMVRRSQESRSRTQTLANRAAVLLTVTGLTVGILTFVVWGLLGQGLGFALERSVTVMVITCPHALGLAIPLVVAVSTSLSARNGLLIRDRTSFERARDIDAVVFDKTGTLTQGRFGVTRLIPLGGRSEDALLSLAASVESQSEHPIAEGVARHAQERGLRVPVPQDFRAIPGRGAQALVDGALVQVVSPGYLRERGIEADDSRIAQSRERGHTVVYVLSGQEERLEGAIALADIVREESREAVRRLKERGVQVMMLTGDARAVAQWVAEELGLDDYFAEVLPDQKAAKIAEVKARGLTVAMVGDGINDAPALVAADVGVAIGAGTDVAIESADVVLVRSDPRDVVAILDLARATYRKMVQNLWWAAGYNIVAIPLAAGVLYGFGFLLPPAAGALLMSLSTVIVALNARLLARRGDRRATPGPHAPPTSAPQKERRSISAHRH